MNGSHTPSTRNWWSASRRGQRPEGLIAHQQKMSPHGRVVVVVVTGGGLGVVV
ncbi:hypothetical protein ACWGE0_09065 [Lentzea sp. NPDC054927]